MRRKEPKPGEWSYTVGEVPVELTALERPDRGNAIYTRIWDGHKYKAKKRLRDPIRDSRGKIDPALELEAQQAAIARQKQAVAGEEPKGPLTVRLGFRKLLDSREGKFATDTAWKKNIEAYAKLIDGQVGDVLCSELRHKHYRTLWRHFAHRKLEQQKGGLRITEKVLGALRSLITWLQTESLLEQGVGLPAPHWGQTLRKEWAEITNKPIPALNKPRYSEDEQKKLWGNLEKADPRIALVMEIGAELRLGQVARCRRSDLLEHDGREVGAIQVHGKGKKMGALVVFTEAQRDAVMTALSSGYLCDLEAAYQAGKLTDYQLITGGRLKKGRAQVKNADTPWDTRRMNRAWLQFETAAEVEHVKSRAWYGTRRLQTDLAEDVTSDARALNLLGGWTHTETREGYQDEGRRDVAVRAKDARALIRPDRKNSPELPQKLTPSEKGGETLGGEGGLSG